MTMNGAAKLRVESWLQVILIMFALAGVLVANEARMTRVEVMIETFLTRFERMESAIDKIVLKTREDQ